MTHSSLPPDPKQDRVTVADIQQEQKVTPPSHLDYGSLTVTLMSSDTPSVSLYAEREFRQLAEQWYMDTLLSSSYFDKILHPAYQKILRLDQAGIPLILRELEAMPNDWFWALRILTDADPVKPEQAGDMQAMADAWIDWGREEGYI